MGVGGAQNWKAEKKYKANSLVYTNDKLYICTEEHTSGADFATDLLSGKWKFIGNGVGSNVVQTVLYEGEVHITAANTDLNAISHTMSDDMTNYDYIIITFHNSGVGRLTVVVKPIIGDYYPGKWSTDLIGADGKTYNASYMIRLFDSRTIYVGLYRPSVTLTGWTYIYVESVVGIKTQELTTSYIASLAMPSDVYESITLNGETGVKFVAPYDGYIGICVLNNSTTVSCIWCYQTENNLINGKRNRIVATPPITTKEHYATVYFPVKKDGVWFLHKIDTNNLIYSNFFTQLVRLKHWA